MLLVIPAAMARMKAPLVMLFGATALATSVAGDILPSRIDDIGFGCDWVEITASSETHATLTYHNCERQVSASGVVTVEDGGIVVSVEVEINGRAADECATVTPEQPFVSIPETDCVEDGGSVSFIITLPMS